MWAELRQDVTYGFRTLLQNRGFAVTAVLTLALGIGANTAIFSVINGVLFRPLPFRDPGRIVFVWSTGQSMPREPLTPGRMVDFREQMTSLSGFAGISQISMNLTGGGEPERIRASSVSSSFFDVLGAAPMLGEPFRSGRASDRDVVLSYGLWVRRFGADRAIVGREITLNGTQRSVVAVMPADFDWPAITGTPGLSPGPELWMPGTTKDIPRMPTEQPDIASNRRAGYLRAVARLADGTSIEQARQEAQAIATRLAQQYPQTDAGRGATIVPLEEQFVGHLQRPMLLLFGGVAFVLAIACANIASLLLGRGAARRKEIALRLALGASRARVMRQLLTESTVLAIVSAGAGLLVAWWALQWLVAASPAGLPGIERAGLDARVLAFTVSLSIVTGLLCGVIPALQSSGADVRADLEAGGRSSDGRRSGRTRDALVAVEIAVALVLLVGAGLLLRSFHSLSRVNTGIDTRNLLTFDLFLGGGRAGDDQREMAFYEQALKAIAAVPGVVRVGAAVTLPIGGDDFGTSVTVEGQPAPARGQEPRVGFQVVTPGYFDAMGIRIAHGRDFGAGDTAAAPPVVMVNETFARQHFPNQEAVGRRVRLGGAQAWATVVGIAGDIRHLGPAAPPRPEIYQPFTQNSFPMMAFVVRTSLPPTAAVPAIRGAISSLDPAQPISGVSTMDQHLATALSRPRFMSTLVVTFGALALVLSMVGVYGVMAYAVVQRTREIAIRAALGATRQDVLRLVLIRALWLAAAGVAAGVAGAAACSRLLAGQLFGVTATDASTYAGAVALLAAVALAAAAIPALRASRIAAADALRG